MWAVLRIRDFRLLWAGRLVSMTGTWLLTVAVPAHVLALTGSFTATGLALAAEYVPVLLLGPLAGVLADRWDRRLLMIRADVARAGIVALMLLATSEGTVWVIYVALAAESAGSILFRPAASAQVPAIVGTGRDLSAANALNAATDGAVRLVAAPVGAAVLVVAGFGPLIWLDAASYLVSALAVAATARTVQAGAAPPGKTGGGLRMLYGNPTARALLLVSIVFLTANAALSALFVPFGVTELGGPEATGLVVSALGAGFLLGAPLTRAGVDRLPAKALLAGGLSCTAGGYLLLFTTHALPVALAAAVLVGLFGSLSYSAPQTLLQRALPGTVLGRAAAALLTAEALATLIGAVAGPAIADRAGLRAVAVAACATTMLAAILAAVLLPARTHTGDHDR